MKRVRSLLVLMLCTAFGTNAFCENYSGSCGSGLKWTLDTSSGLLTIQGTGEMTSSPWSNYAKEIKKVIISEGVKSIGDYAFSQCSSLTSITIPKGVTSIGYQAFFNCSSLASITLPEGVTSIGNEAFMYCCGLASITLPEGVTSIGSRAFAGCSSLASITIPKGVTSIGDNAFAYFSGLTSITIPEGVTSIGNYAFDSCSSLTAITLPESLTNIGNYAFDSCSSLTAITLPESLTSIGKSAFRGCSGLAAITIPEGVTSIGDNAFICSSLTSITILGGVTNMGQEVFSGCNNLANVTLNCSTITSWFSEMSIKTVTLGEKVTSIESRAFYGCNRLSSINIPESVTSIGDYAFYGCHSLSSITLPEGVTSIGIGAFKSCSKLANVTINCHTVGPWFKSSPIVSVTFGGKATKIESSAFRDCSSLTSIAISKGVTSIGQEAFYGCKNLKIVVNNSTLNITKGSSSYGYVGYYAAIVLTNGVNVVKEGDFWVTYQGEDKIATYYEGSGGDVIIPEGMTSIGNEVFSDCSSLSSITIPESVKSIGSSTFSRCRGLASVTINCPTIGSWFSGLPINTVTLGKKVTSIGSSAFEGCSSLVSIAIPESVTNIGSSAFEGCSSLVSITIPKSVKSIGSSVFRNCSSLTSIAIPEGVMNIGNSAFYDCKSLATITIPNSVTSVGESAFYGCTLKSLTIGAGVLSLGNNCVNNRPKKTIWLCNTPPSNYTITNGEVNYVANKQFSKLSNVKVYPQLSSLFEVDGVKYAIVNPSEKTCDAIDCAYGQSIEKISIGKSVTYKNISLKVTSVNEYACYANSFIKSISIEHNGDILGHAFDNCDNLQTVSIYNNGKIGNNAFYDCDKLQTVLINNTGSIGANAFKSCDNLKTAGLGGGVSAIGDYAFNGCSKLEHIVIPNSATSVGEYCFGGCSGLLDAIIGSKVATVGKNAFEKCPSLTQVTITDGAQKFASRVFSQCSALKEISIPQSVSSIGEYAFEGCTALKNLVIEDRKEPLTLSSNDNNPLFHDCPLNTVYIGGKIAYQTSPDCGYSPFYRNTSLKAVTIADTEENIYDNEFYGCSALKDVTIGDGVKTIGNWAFSGCSSLDFFSYGTGMQSIGKEAFSDCTAVTKIISQAATPPTCGAQALEDINKWECELIVPTNHKAEYAAADQWKDFFFINEEDVIRTYRITLDAEYSTWIVPLNVALPDGLKAYTCSSADGNTLVLTPAESIRAGVPYIVKGEAGKAYEVTGIYQYGTNLSYGCLTGLYEDAKVSDVYVLQNGDKGLGFYRIGNNSYMVTAHHCYLTINGNGNQVLYLDNASEIEMLKAEESSSEDIYDLSGRRIDDADAVRGIYLQNGKKVYRK